MSSLLFAYLLIEVALSMTEARVCRLGNEPDPDQGKVTRWVTLPASDPCDCSVVLLGGCNAVPVLRAGGSPFVPTDHPLVSSDPEQIGSHFGCDSMQQGVQEPTTVAVTSESPPPGEWIKLLHYDRSNPTSVEPDQSVLDDWEEFQIKEVKVSLRGKSAGLDLSFDAKGSNSASWFAYDRLLNSPWADLDRNAIFSLNWTATGSDILGITAEVRGGLAVQGWLRWVPPNTPRARTWPDEQLPVIAFSRAQNKVHWMDRDLLSRGRPSSQSSTPAPARGQYAVDSDLRTRTSTAYEFQPWWVVDMGDTFRFDKIIIRPCQPSYGKTELAGAQFLVGAGTSQALADGAPCGSTVEQPASGTNDTLVVWCQSGMQCGRYLGVRIDGDYGALGFCDLEIDGSGPQFRSVAGQPTWQSSVLARNASLCVDGREAVHEAELTCCQTEGQSDPWWQVDLGEEVHVSRVVISPFPDLNKWSLMAGATIGVSEVDDPYASAEPCGGALHSEELQKHRPLLVECVPSVLGRYVFVRGVMPLLSMCEVEVFGEAKEEVYHADTLSIEVLLTEE